MIKYTAIVTALAALPLLAQEPQSAPAPSARCSASPGMKCCKCGHVAAAQCTQASVAAAVGFQKGFQMGFETGFNQAAKLMSACSGSKGTPPPATPQPTPRPAGDRQAAQPIPLPL